MKTIFYTICTRDIQNNPVNSRNLDFAGFMNSFKRFHPDIEMKVFDETDLKKYGLNFYNAKATLGRVLSEQFDLVVNVDADHYFFDRCNEILSADYDVACPPNFNITDNLVGVKVTSGIHGEANKNWLINEQMFLQGGLIASPNKQFWEHYEYCTMQFYEKFHCFENDILNLVAWLYPYEIKPLDGSFELKGKSCWYGCAIIGKEQTCYIENDKIMCEGIPVKAYHFAHGSAKRKYDDVFNNEVSKFIRTHII